MGPFQIDGWRVTISWETCIINDRRCCWKIIMHVKWIFIWLDLVRFSPGWLSSSRFLVCKAWLPWPSTLRGRAQTDADSSAMSVAETVVKVWGDLGGDLGTRRGRNMVSIVKQVYALKYYHIYMYDRPLCTIWTWWFSSNFTNIWLLSIHSLVYRFFFSNT